MSEVEMSGGGADMPGIIYSLIARGTIVMVEYSSREGNFVTLAKRILTSVQSGDHKRSFFDKSGRYVFHYVVKEGVTFMCFATKEHKTAVCFAFLDEISKRFKATYEANQIENAMAYSPQFEEFSRVVEQEMNRFGHMKFADNKIAEVSDKVEATKQVMKDNVQKVIDRGDNIESLIEKTDILVQRADSFRVNTKTLERKMWWKNVKIWIILIVVVIILTWLIFSIVCGFDFICLRGGSVTPCFHENTQINYKGKHYSLHELSSMQEKECVVPHIVSSSSSVRIFSSCSSSPLMLTSDHLVYTAQGLKAASNVVSGDLLYSDIAQTQLCQVTNVVNDTTEQKFFGLNCLSSQVLADNVKCSTFGNYHTVPAVWMAAAGRVFGVQWASSFGDKVAQTLHKIRIL